ncbi:protein BTG4 isoform X2 [Chiloscyllium plagiosum]|uniref:protein BTG4 isoform X2 n=2 Tax=Chiloscyllium plagiosum TaxID=36176 RepID=UPI001CB825F1|nr:protein BTG4 isoform X2 [Chiloscyllium plagiosum]
MGSTDWTMKEEIAATVVFISRIVKKNEKLSKKKIEKFCSKLTKVLFEKYKNHWYWGNPAKGQAYRCIRVNKSQPLDPVLLQACVESNIEYSSLQLPRELTIWVDPYEVWCRCGEKNQPFIVTRLEESNTDLDIFKDISSAAERAGCEYNSGTSSDEEGYKEPNPISVRDTHALYPAGEQEDCSVFSERKTIPIVNNPNSIYQFEVCTSFKGRGSSGQGLQTIPTVINPKSIYQANDYYSHPTAGWPKFLRRKMFAEDYSCHSFPGNYRVYRASNMFLFPRVDRYHWVNTKR